MTTSVRLGDADGNTLLWLRTASPSRDDPVVASKVELPIATPRVVDQPRPGRSGRIDLTALHDAATFRADLYIRDRDGATRHQWADILRGLITAGQRPYLYVQRDGWLAERRAVVRGDSFSFMSDPAAAVTLRASLQLVIPDGELEDIAERSAIIRPASAQIGRTYPKTYPWAYASANPTSAATVTSAGNVSTPPMLRLYGAFTDPTITNQTTGLLLALTSITVAAGNYLEIDVANRTVRLNGDPGLNYYNKLNFAASDWWEIQPGNNTITATATTLDASCELDITWRDRWI